MIERPEPVATVEALRLHRFAKALAVFCSGSVVRGEGTAHSDLDVVVLFEQVPHAERESLVVDGWPVELFIHDLETLAYFFHEDSLQLRPALATMVSEGIVLPRSTELTDKVQAWARRVLAKPCELKGEKLDSARYCVTDLLDDLRDPRPRSELLAIVARLHPVLASFILSSNGKWVAAGKHIPRALRALEPTLATDFDEAFDAVFQRSDPAPLIAFTERMLEASGGRLFAGFTSAAKAEWRREVPDLELID